MERLTGLICSHRRHPILFADPSIPFQFYLDQIGSPSLYIPKYHYETSPAVFSTYKPSTMLFSPASHSISALSSNSVITSKTKLTTEEEKLQTTTSSVITKSKSKPRWRVDLKKYRCDLCSQCFSRSNTLVTHRRIHTGEKPFKCDKCGRHFRQHGNLTRHKLTHTSIKPFACHICNRAFNRRSNLKTHSKIHRQQT